MGMVEVEIQFRKSTLPEERVSETNSKWIRQILENLLQEWQGSSGQKSRFDFCNAI
jgi:hypothetical protein